ncbi:uncharacterized protein VTP21DRAFT_1403 [Calcarisporiella thermophila]|uniref:uncharacterized protein n=1 Tax=Calcarisporiella thermophila TaxID=911321 RepID=UPI003742C849
MPLSGVKDEKGPNVSPNAKGKPSEGGNCETLKGSLKNGEQATTGSPIRQAKLSKYRKAFFGGGFQTSPSGTDGTWPTSSNKSHRVVAMPVRLTLLLSFILAWCILANAEPLLGNPERSPTTGTLCFENNLMCIAATIDAKLQEVEITMIGSQDIGWMGLGIGPWMTQADLMIAWAHHNYGNITLSDRYAVEYVEPKLSENQTLRLVPEMSGIREQKLYITLRRPLLPRSTSREYREIRPGIEAEWLWAVSDLKPRRNDPASRAYKHTAKGRFRMTITSDRGIEGASERGTPVKSRELFQLGGIVFAHGILMSLIWLVFMPLSVFTARYLRNYLGPWWFPVHWGVAAGAGIFLSFVGFALAYIGNHGGHFNTPHKFSGILFLCLCLLQGISGVMIDRMYDPYRTKVPPRDHIHRWFGIAISLFAVALIALGLVEFGGVPGWLFGLLGGWAGLVVVIFILAWVYSKSAKRQSEEAKDRSFIPLQGA